MGNLRYDDTVEPETVTFSYEGEQYTFQGYRPLAQDSTWDELEAYLILLRDYYQRDGHKVEEVCQALLDRYIGEERTSELKEEMRTIW